MKLKRYEYNENRFFSDKCWKEGGYVVHGRWKVIKLVKNVVRINHYRFSFCANDLFLKEGAYTLSFNDTWRDFVVKEITAKNLPRK